jgi:ribonuclease P protein subunit RPR2
MAADKKVKGPTNRHLHARTTFLYQAATYLTLQVAREPEPNGPQQAAQECAGYEQIGRPRSGLALQLATQLRTVSRKGQLKLSTDIKRQLCKTCNTMLIPGETSTHSIQNDSRGGKKPWADVLVITCHTCTSRKHFPVGVKRQQKKHLRQNGPVVSVANTDPAETPAATTSAFQTATEQSTSSS